ncbi:tetratricopeptide repeat protein [bacterium]|nr:tetratricopeptide repeat protein [bacterium]
MVCPHHHQTAQRLGLIGAIIFMSVLVSGMMSGSLVQGQIDTGVSGSNPDQVRALLERANTQLQIGDFSRAETLYRQALDLERAGHGPSLTTARILVNLGALYQAMGELTRARSHYDQAISVYETNGLEDGELITVLSNRALLAETQGGFAEAEQTWRRILNIQERTAPDSPGVASSLHQLGKYAQLNADNIAAKKFYLRALDLEKRFDPNSEYVVTNLEALVAITINDGEFEQALDCLEQAFSLEKQRSAEGAVYARLLNLKATVKREQGELDQAEALAQKALDIQGRMTPPDLDRAASLSNLGRLALIKGDYNRAEQFLDQARHIREQLVPQSTQMVASLTDLGNLAYARGDLHAAEQLYNRALDLQQLLLPHSQAIAISLNNLGGVLLNRGDLAQAEAYYQKALDLLLKIGPTLTLTANSYNNLGIVAAMRTDFVTAEHYFQKATDVWNQIAPGSLERARCLTNLGELSREKGDYNEAERYHQEALALTQSVAPNTEIITHCYHNLADVYRARGDDEQAERLYHLAFEHNETLAPGSLNSTFSLHDLGQIALKRQQYDLAEKYYRQAQTILEKLAPFSINLAECYQSLGKLERERHNLSRAREYLEKAVALLEGQAKRLGGSKQDWQQFREHYDDMYRDLLEVQVELGLFVEAFHTLERSKARVLLEILAERDLQLPLRAETDMQDILRDIQTEYDQIQGELSLLDSRTDTLLIKQHFESMHLCQKRKDELIDKIRKQSPEYASLHYPQPLQFADLDNVLDPGTALLAYKVTPALTYVFCVSTQNHGTKLALTCLKLPVGSVELHRTIRHFLAMVRARESISSLEQAGKKLYDLLIAPAETALASSTRLLIVPDGPLYSLPFAALTRTLRAEPGAKNMETRAYLISWKPIHTVVSLTVYAELRKNRKPIQPPDSESLLIAFGNPDYHVAATAQPEHNPNVQLRSLLARGIVLEPLPGSRAEVESICALFGRSARIFLDEAATEEQVYQLPRTTRLLHFACHGFIDELFPLDSALALSIPGENGSGRENGLLQAWEIFEKVRLEADLVTLSACNTAQGKQVSGEGIIGLTRAFQYAGARSILASLWSVPDISTKELTVRFYNHLQNGKSKDEALQAAQMDLLSNPTPGPDSTNHPLHWAAFSLIGDWK